MQELPSRAFALALALTMVSCGPDKSTESTDGSTDTGQSTDPTSGTNGTAACQDALPEDMSGAPVTIKLRNARAEPVYLDQASNCNADYAYPFGMRDGDGAVAFAPGDCDYGCNLVPSDACGCNEFCIDPPVLLLQPGATYTTTWSSRVLRSVPVPQGCPSGSLCMSTCEVFQPIDPGTYTVHTLAAAEIMCIPAGDDPSSCTCTPNADGWCWLQYDGYESVAPVEFTAQITVPGDAAIELVIQ